MNGASQGCSTLNKKLKNKNMNYKESLQKIVDVIDNKHQGLKLNITANEVDIYNIATEALQSESESEWISVEDRLPEIGEYVIAFDGEEQKVVKMTTYKEGSNGYQQGLRDCWFEYISHNNYAFRFYNVTHWMPLPQAPSIKTPKI